ncbi:MAG: cupin domain-containing protein [Syntrophorhabdaceae bacterium]|nr:cupin domain-containing protein [Syntrophorhabdaceae bacterium]
MRNEQDPARASNRTREEIRTRGAIFNINEGIDIESGKNCITRLIGWPGVGTRMVAFHLLIHKPGGGFDMHSHPISEESVTCIKGRGEVNFGSGWVKVEAGNVLFFPIGCVHATRNDPSSDEDFIALSYVCPSPLEYYQEIGLMSGGEFNITEIDKLILNSTRDNIPRECVMKANELGGHERAEVKGYENVAKTGGVFNIYRGAPFTAYGGYMKFIVWPGVGAKNCGLHNAHHEPGLAFKPHVHPISEDAILFWKGEGMAYLESRWIECWEGDILYAPALVRHGTGCRKDQGPMDSSGCATPPQFDLYERAGYLKQGRFVDFPVE